MPCRRRVDQGAEAREAEPSITTIYDMIAGEANNVAVYDAMVALVPDTQHLYVAFAV